MTLLGIPNIVAVAVFSLCAAVQFNDPDPGRWIAIYGVAAAISAATVRGAVLPVVRGSVGIAAMIWAVTLLQNVRPPIEWLPVFVDAGMKSNNTEIIREALGLSLVAGWMLVGARYSHRVNDEVSEMTQDKELL